MDVKFLVVVLALLAGCSTTPAKSVHLPDGTQGYSIDCAWSGEWASCMNKAATLCGGRYTVISQGGSSNGGMAVQAGAATVSASSSVQEMIIQCDN